jgi:hypothetical protein
VTAAISARGFLRYARDARLLSHAFQVLPKVGGLCFLSYRSSPLAPLGELVLGEDGEERGAVLWGRV